MNDKIKTLFREYEDAFNRLDIKKNASLYTDTFISAGPKGTIAQSKEDFLQMAEQAAAFYRRVGQKSGCIISMKEIPISDEYTLVTVHWGVVFEKTGDKPVEFDVSYLVQDIGEEPKIILFISHEDEEETMKELGLLQQN